ncbi:MAG: MFS transporter [Erysipelotrichaceae bacterium]|nr:MFS transporter [Erysipelotrichaceae bacterium]
MDLKGLQMKYNFVHILYWITSCTVYGYVAVYLQYKGLSNTLIGIVTGGAALSSVFVSPFISSLLSKIKGLTIKKLMTILYLLMFVFFESMNLFSLPTFLLMGLYIALICMMASVVPILSMICMNYIKGGQYVDFGLSRGMGSLSYAISAFVLGQLIEIINASIIGWVHLISSIALLILLYSMPDSDIQSEDSTKEEGSVFDLFKKYKVFVLILCAFAFQFGAASSLSTYLVNIVTNLGGSTSLYGVAIFAMAASELPFMAITHTLLKRYKSETIILVASFFYLLRNFTISFAPALPILIVGMMFQGISYGMFTATITYYVNDYLDASDQMMGQTLIAMMSTGIGSFVGNVVGGVLQDTFGLFSMKLFACTLTVIGFAIMFTTLKGKIGKVNVAERAY